MQKREIYRCSVCGIIVETLVVGGGELVCCEKPMLLLSENTVEASKEKHVPVVEKTAAGWKVKVGSVPHPMEEKHFIQWIELIADGNSCPKFLKPGEAPEAEFALKADKVTAREYCNLHGLWSGK